MKTPNMIAPGHRWQAARAQGQGNDAEIVADTGDGAQVDDQAEAFATLRARAARAGSRLYALDGGGYLLTRWTLARDLPDLHAVSQLLAAMGVP